MFSKKKTCIFYFEYDKQTFSCTPKIGGARCKYSHNFKIFSLKKNFKYFLNNIVKKFLSNCFAAKKKSRKCTHSSKIHAALNVFTAGLKISIILFRGCNIFLRKSYVNFFWNLRIRVCIAAWCSMLFFDADWNVLERRASRSGYKFYRARGWFFFSFFLRHVRP